MKSSTKVLLITVGVGVPAFLAGPVLFPPAADITPTPTQMALLMPVFAIEALALGLAVAFVRFGWPLVRRVVGESRRLAWATYVSCTWLLGNWWVHNNLHVSNGLDIDALIAIDWSFHTTLVLAGAVVCYAFVEALRTGRLRLAQPLPGSESSDRTPAGVR